MFPSNLFNSVNSVQTSFTRRRQMFSQVKTREIKTTEKQHFGGNARLAFLADGSFPAGLCDNRSCLLVIDSYLASSVRKLPTVSRFSL